MKRWLRKRHDQRHSTAGPARHNHRARRLSIERCEDRLVLSGIPLTTGVTTAPAIQEGGFITVHSSGLLQTDANNFLLLDQNDLSSLFLTNSARLTTTLSSDVSVDPLTGNQRHLIYSGQQTDNTNPQYFFDASGNGTHGVPTWNLSTRGERVTVAAGDTSAEKNHPDLTANTLANSSVLVATPTGSVGDIVVTNITGNTDLDLLSHLLGNGQGVDVAGTSLPEIAFQSELAGPIIMDLDRLITTEAQSPSRIDVKPPSSDADRMLGNPTFDNNAIDGHALDNSIFENGTHENAFVTVLQSQAHVSALHNFDVPDLQVVEPLVPTANDPITLGTNLEIFDSVVDDNVEGDFGNKIDDSSGLPGKTSRMLVIDESIQISSSQIAANQLEQREGGALGVFAAVITTQRAYESQLAEVIARNLDRDGTLPKLAQPQAQPLVAELARAIAFETMEPQRLVQADATEHVITDEGQFADPPQATPAVLEPAPVPASVTSVGYHSLPEHRAIRETTGKLGSSHSANTKAGEHIAIPSGRVDDEQAAAHAVTYATWPLLATTIAAGYLIIERQQQSDATTVQMPPRRQHQSKNMLKKQLR